MDFKKIDIPIIRIDFVLLGERLDFNQITRKLGIQPTKVKSKHDFPDISKQMGYAKDTWKLSTSQTATFEISEEVRILMRWLESKKEDIVQIQQIFKADVSVNISVHAIEEKQPAYILEKDVIAFLGNIGARAGFDLYVYNNSDIEDE